MTHTEEFGVDDTGWIIEKLGEDVLPEQDKRELTENGVLAVLRELERSGGSQGELLWDVDDIYFQTYGVRKICLIDTGDAFDEASFRANIMRLAPRGKDHTSLKRFGVGAKIAGVTKHPHGMIYQSWREPDTGIFAHLWRDPDTGTYGLRAVENDDGKFETIVPIDGTLRPPLIHDRGTKVTLLGPTEQTDTFGPPPGNPHGGKWLSRYLNSRYFELPPGVRLRVREGETYVPGELDTGRLRTISGQRSFLDERSSDRGVFVGTDFRIRWWILDDGPDRLKDSHYVTSGFVAAKFLHELFELREGRSAPTVLQRFGITFGFMRVVLVLEPGVTDPDPDSQADPVHASVDLQRAHLKHNGLPLDWDRYATEFRTNMPQPLKDFVEEQAHGTDDTDRRKRYRNQMEKLKELFRLPRYRPASNGPEEVDPAHTGPGGHGERAGKRARTRGTGQLRLPGGDPVGATGNVYPLRRRPDGIKGVEVSTLPDVEFRWVSDLDPHLPARGGELEDRAARYIPETNTLLINADFRLFELIADHWLRLYGQRPAARGVITEAVRDVYTGVLVETVVGMLAFRGDQLWPESRLVEALSEEALTAAVMPRVAPHRQIGQILRSRFPGVAAQGA